MHGGALLRRERLAIVRAMKRGGRGVVNRVPAVLASRGLRWDDLARRTLLCPHALRGLRRPGANPRIGVATRIASALDVQVERLWTLVEEP